MIRIVSLTKTLEALPSLWEGRTHTGEWIHVRYRWGLLTIGLGATREEAIARGLWEGRGGRTIFADRIGGAFDGWLSFEDLVRATAGVIAWECEPPAEATRAQVEEACRKTLALVHQLVEEGKATLVEVPREEMIRLAEQFRLPTRPGVDVRCPRCGSLQPVTEVPVPPGRTYRCTCGDVFVEER